MSQILFNIIHIMILGKSLYELVYNHGTTLQHAVLKKVV